MKYNHGEVKNGDIHLMRHYVLATIVLHDLSLTLHTLAESVSYFSLDYRSYLPIVYVYLR